MQLKNRVSRRRSLVAALALLAVGIAALSFLRLYFIQALGGGQLFWNAREADIFLVEREAGYSFRCIYFPLAFLRSRLPFGSTDPAASHLSMTVLRITPVGIQRYHVDDFWPAGIKPFQGTLYSGNLLPGGRLMKWTGTRFVPVTGTEADSYWEHAQKLPAQPSYRDEEGWSKETITGNIDQYSATRKETDRAITLEIGGQKFTLVLNSGFFTGNAYLILEHPPKPADTIWRLNEKFHRVSGGEYRKIFDEK